MNQSHWVRIGKLVRKHGIKGHLVLILDAAGLAFIEQGHLFVEIDGIKVPFFIDEHWFFNPKEVLLLFEDYHDTEKAGKLLGKDVWIKATETTGESKEPGLEDLLGFMIVDKKHGQIGPVLDILELSGNNLFRTEYRGEELLLPAVEEMIQSIDTRKALVHVRLPEGLLDLGNPGK